MSDFFREISYEEARDFLLPRHYSGRIPSISYSFGVFDERGLSAVCTFGKPASNSLCIGVCGKEYSSKVYELNRLCRTKEYYNPLSKFVSWCLRRLSLLDLIIVSYSDTAMNHASYIYQACNFLYTGKTKQRTDIYTPNGRHSRHYDPNEKSGMRKVRSSKHRYLYFATRKKGLRRIFLSKLKYPIEKFPKTKNNDDYELGFVLKDKIIRK